MAANNTEQENSLLENEFKIIMNNTNSKIFDQPITQLFQAPVVNTATVDQMMAAAGNSTQSGNGVIGHQQDLSASIPRNSSSGNLNDVLTSGMPQQGVMAQSTVYQNVVQQQQQQISADVANFIQSLPPNATTSNPTTSAPSAIPQQQQQFTQPSSNSNTSPFILNVEMAEDKNSPQQQIATDVANFIQSLPSQQSNQQFTQQQQLNNVANFIKSLPPQQQNSTMEMEDKNMQLNSSRDLV